MADQAARNRQRWLQVGLLGLVTVVTWPLAVHFRLSAPAEPTTTPDVAPLEPPSSAPAGSATAAVETTAAATAAAIPAAAASADAGSSPTPAPSTSATAPPPMPDSKQLNTCVSALFPADSFHRGQPDFSFVCGERYPRKAVTQIQAQLSLAQWGTSESTAAMREWAVLKWYEFAALAVLRGRCCAKAEPLDWGFKLACPIDQVMDRIERAVRASDQAALDAAVVEYGQVATCLTRQGQAPNFGQSDLPGPGVSALRRMLERAGRRDGQ